MRELWNSDAVGTPPASDGQSPDDQSSDAPPADASASDTPPADTPAPDTPPADTPPADSPSPDTPAADDPAPDSPSPDAPPKPDAPPQPDSPPTGPAWTLTLHAGPLPSALGTARIDITEITWTVTPDWDASAAKTVKTTPSPPTATGSVKLPAPPGAVKTVTVVISGSWSTKGGDVGGYPVPPQAGSVLTNSAKVGFGGSDETMGWLLTVEAEADGTSGIFAVVPILQGITP